MNTIQNVTDCHTRAFSDLALVTDLVVGQYKHTSMVQNLYERPSFADRIHNRNMLLASESYCVE